MPGGGPLQQAGTSDSNGRELANLEGKPHDELLHSGRARVRAAQDPSRGGRSPVPASAMPPAAGWHARRSQIGAWPAGRLVVTWRCWRPAGIEDHHSFESGVVSYTRAGWPARAERRVDDLAEDHHVARAVGGMARDAGGPLPARHRPGPDRRHRHLPALVHMLFLARHFPGRRPDVAVPARRSPGLLAARPGCPAATWTISCSWPSAATWPSLSCCARRPGAEVPGRSLVLGVRSATARRDQPQQVRRGTRRAVGRGPVRDRPWRRPGRPDRSRGGGQAVAGHPAGRDGSRPAAPRCGCGSGRAGRGRRHLRQRNGELPGAPERPRRRDRIGCGDPVHDLAASWLAWDGGVPVRRLAAQRGTRRARGGCVPPGRRPRSGGGDRLAAGERRLAAHGGGRSSRPTRRWRRPCCSSSPARCSARSTCSGSPASPRRAWPQAGRRSARSRSPCWPPPGSHS